MRYIRGVFLLLVLLLGFAPPAHAQGQTVPRIEAGPCARPTGSLRVDCGTLVVPERFDRPAGRLVRLPYMYIHSASGAPSADPVVIAANGGPGESVLAGFNGRPDAPWLAERDMVLLEQRGTRLSDPFLECTDTIGDALLSSFATTLDNAAEARAVATQVAACRDQLRAQGIDLSAYNSISSAADLDALRQLLGIEQWNLYGESYATHFILTYARHYPARVRSMALDSLNDPAINKYEVLLPNLLRALDQVAAGCAADASCHTAYPDLRAHLFSVVARLNVQPATLQIAHPRTKAPFTVRFTGNDLLLGLLGALYDPQTIGMLPLIIEELHAGHMSAVEPVVEQGLAGLYGRSQSRAFYYTVECHEEAPFNRWEQIARQDSGFAELAGFSASPWDGAICPIWGAGQADPVENTAVSGNIPTLVVAGAYDPVLAPALQAAAAARFSPHYFYTFPHTGHPVSRRSDCSSEMAAAFFRDPQHAPNAGCIARIPPIRFITATADVLPTPAIYRLNRDVLAQPDWLQLGVLGICLVLLLAQLMVSIVALGRRRASYLSLLALVAALSLLGLLGLLAGAIATSGALVLGFGLPSWIGGWRWLGPLGMCATAALTIAYGVSVSSRLATRTSKAWYGLTASAALVLCFWLIAHGLLFIV